MPKAVFPRSFVLHPHHGGAPLPGVELPGGHAVVFDDPESGASSGAPSVADLCRGYPGARIEWADEAPASAAAAPVDSTLLPTLGQRHHPDGTGNKGQQDDAARARSWCQAAFGSGYGTWADVLTEGVAEAFAESDYARLRAELIQVTSVCARWITDIDSRPNSSQPAAT